MAVSYHVGNKVWWVARATCGYVTCLSGSGRERTIRTGKVHGLGISALGELVGWALPNQFPPRNRRTSNAIRALGYDVTIHLGE
jgi:hypothetical protein